MRASLRILLRVSSLTRSLHSSSSLHLASIALNIALLFKLFPRHPSISSSLFDASVFVFIWNSMYWWSLSDSAFSLTCPS